MNLLLCLLLIGLSAVSAQENSLAKVPESLLECYNNTYLLNRNNRLPHNIPSLIAIIQKIEDFPGLNMDLRTLSVALLHRFRQDGIVQNPTVPVQEGVTPFAPLGFQFFRHAATLRMIPGNAMAFPNDSISAIERCSLHAMLSSSIDILERGDESTTCRTSSPYRHSRQMQKRSDKKSAKLTEDVETLTDEQLETMSNKDEPKDTGVDPNSWYPALPPNHPESARVFQLPPMSKCPVENGVIRTDWGPVAGGAILAGIAAGVEPQPVKLGDLLQEEWQSRDALSNATLDNKWIATFAGDLAEVSLRQGPLASKGLTIGVDGHWNSSSLPLWYFLNSDEKLELTSAEIRGDLDGLIFASLVGDWRSTAPNIKLSQILDMYYSQRGVFSWNTKACSRKIFLTAVAPKAQLIEQTYRSALVLRAGVAKVTMEPATIEKFVGQAVEKLLTFIPSSLNDIPCEDIPKRNNPISTDITIFLDTTWAFASVQPILASLLEKLEINKYNSNFTLISAHTGDVMIPSSNSILDFYYFNETQYSNFSRGFDLPRVFETIQSMESKKLEKERNNGLGGGKSEIALIVPYTSTISDAHRDYCLEVFYRLSEDAPDANIMFLTYGASDRWSGLVRDPSTEIVSLGVSTTNNYSVPINSLLTTIRQVPRRLINSQCGATYSQSGSGNSYGDYPEPYAINFYRLHPNYFYSSDSDDVSTIKIRSSDPSNITVCSARNMLQVRERESDTCETSSNEISITVSCGDATLIHECSPLYISVKTDLPSSSMYRCDDERFCRFPDTTKLTFSYENLRCANGVSSIIYSPIILLSIVIYSLKQ